MREISMQERHRDDTIQPAGISRDQAKGRVQAVACDPVDNLDHQSTATKATSAEARCKNALMWLRLVMSITVDVPAGPSTTLASCTGCRLCDQVRPAKLVAAQATRMAARVSRRPSCPEPSRMVGCSIIWAADAAPDLEPFGGGCGQHIHALGEAIEP